MKGLGLLENFLLKGNHLYNFSAVPYPDKSLLEPYYYLKNELVKVGDKLNYSESREDDYNGARHKYYSNDSVEVFSLDNRTSTYYSFEGLRRKWKSKKVQSNGN